MVGLGTFRVACSTRPRNFFQKGRTRYKEIGSVRVLHDPHQMAMLASDLDQEPAWTQIILAGCTLIQSRPFYTDHRLQRSEDRIRNETKTTLTTSRHHYRRYFYCRPESFSGPLSPCRLPARHFTRPGGYSSRIFRRKSCGVHTPARNVG